MSWYWKCTNVNWENWLKERNGLLLLRDKQVSFVRQIKISFKLTISKPYFTNLQTESCLTSRSRNI